jgi:hypothetical protein
VDSVKGYQTKATEYLSTRKTELLRKIGVEKAVSDALAAELKAAFTEFNPTYAASRAKTPALKGPAQ